MAVDGKTDAEIIHILHEAKLIAVVGASDKAERPSNSVLAFLVRRGYRVIAVNPGLAGRTIHGAPVVAKLSDIEEPIDIVDVFRNSEDAGKVVDEALALPFKPAAIWLQLGVINPAARTRAEAQEVAVVMDRCPAIEIPRLDI